MARERRPASSSKCPRCGSPQGHRRRLADEFCVACEREVEQSEVRKAFARTGRLDLEPDACMVGFFVWGYACEFPAKWVKRGFRYCDLHKKPGCVRIVKPRVE